MSLFTFIRVNGQVNKGRRSVIPGLKRILSENIGITPHDPGGTRWPSLPAAYRCRCLNVRQSVFFGTESIAEPAHGESGKKAYDSACTMPGIT